MRRNTSKDFSFFVYMAGDNTLSDYTMTDLVEMQNTGSVPSNNIIVEIDTAGNFGVKRYRISEKDPRTGSAHAEIIQRLPEADTGDPKTLSTFLKWAKTTYPAKKYGVVVWNHGSGFRDPRTGRNIGSSRLLFRHSIKNHDSSRGIASDDMTGHSMDMIELGHALSRSGFSGTNKIEVLGFDACLMNMLEVSYEMSKYANYLVASEEEEPGDGWPYTADVNSLNKSRKNSFNLVKEFVKNYRKYYNKPSMKDAWPITQSAISLNLVSELANSVDSLGKALGKLLPNKLVDISDIRETVQCYAPKDDFDDYVDVGDLADLCYSHLGDQNVKNAATSVINSLKKAVVAEDHLGESVSNSHGLTIWFPETSAKYHSHKIAYSNLTVTKKYKNWNSFLASYHTLDKSNKISKKRRYNW